MLQYQQFLNDIMTNGRYKENRTGTGAYAIAGHQMRFDLSAGFPLVTTKKCHLRSIIHELLWFIRGDTSNQSLNDIGVTIWDEWAVPEDGEYRKYFHRLPELKEEYKRLKGWGEFEWNIFTLSYAEKHNTDRHAPRVQSDILEAMKADGIELFRKVPKIRKGELGPIYGKQWRDWVGVSDRYDQLKTMVETLKNNPTSRRIIVSAWNPDDLPDEKLSPQENVKNGKMALAPCHCFFQALPLPLTARERLHLLPQEIKDTIKWKFDKDQDGNPPPSLDEQIEAASSVYDEAGIPKYMLNLQVYIRSNDAFLGAPYNIASYALLTMMLAQVSGMIPGELIYTVGDAHVYENHEEQVATQLARQPYELPTMHLNPAVNDLFDFKFDDFSLINYVSHPAIKAPIAI